MPAVRARESAVVTTSDGITHAVREDERFDVDDLVVEEFKWLFRAEVEEATARPGDKRSRGAR